MARDFLAETETIMILTDPNGMILGVEGDPRVEAAADIHLGRKQLEQLICRTARQHRALNWPTGQIMRRTLLCRDQARTCSATVIRDPYDGRSLRRLMYPGWARHSAHIVWYWPSRQPAESRPNWPNWRWTFGISYSKGAWQKCPLQTA